MEVGDISSTPARVLIYIIISAFVSNFVYCSKISDQRLCGDKECKALISEAKTLGSYASRSPYHLSFKRGQIIKIYSKSAGDKPEFWGGEVDGNRGYFPKTFVREMNVLIHSPSFTVATEISEDQLNSKKTDRDPVKSMDQGDDTEQGETTSTTNLKDDTELGDETDVVDVDESNPTVVIQEEYDSELDDDTESLGGDGTDVEEEVEGAEKDIDETDLDADIADSSDAKDDTELKDETVDEPKTVTANTPDSSGADTQNMEETQDSTKEVNTPVVSTDETEVDETEVREEESSPPGEAIKPDPDDITQKQKTENVTEVDYAKLREKAAEKEIDELMQHRVKQTEDVELSNSAGEDIDALNALLMKSTGPKNAEHRSEDKPDSETPSQPEIIDGGDGQSGAPEGKIVEQNVAPGVITPKDTVEILEETKTLAINDTDEQKDYIKPDPTELTDIPEAKEEPQQDLHVVKLEETGTPEPQHKALKEEALDIKMEIPEVNTLIDDEQVKDESVSQDEHGKLTEVLPDEALSHTTILPEESPEGGDVAEDLSDTSLLIKATPSVPDTPSSTVYDDAVTSTEAMTVESSEMAAIPTDMGDKTEATSTESLSPSVESQAESPSGNYEVFEGTTIYLDEVPASATPSIDISASTHIVSSAVHETANELPLVRDILNDAFLATSAVESADTLHSSSIPAASQDLGGSEYQMKPNVSVEEEIAEVKPPGFPDDAYHTLDFMSRKPLSNENFNPTPRADEEPKKSDFPAEQPVPDHKQREVNQEPEMREEVNTGNLREETKEPEDTSHDGSDKDTVLERAEKEEKNDDQQESDNRQTEETKPEEAKLEETMSEDGKFEETVSEDGKFEESKSEETMSEETTNERTEAEIPETDTPTLDPVTSPEPPHHETTQSSSDSVPELSDNDQSVEVEQSTPSPDSTPSEPEPVTETPSEPEEPDPREVTPPLTTPSGQESFNTGLPDDLKHPDQKDDPYASDDQWSRRITDVKIEEEMYASSFQIVTKQIMSGVDSTLQYILMKLPPSIQNILEQEPLWLSPPMMVLVSIATFVVLVTVTCCSCLCGSSGRKGKKSDPLVVVRGLEEKLFVTTKEKENLEDELADMKKRMKSLETQVVVQQKSSGSNQKEIQNIKLHNEALKQTIASLQAEIESYKETFNQAEVSLQEKQEEMERLEQRLRESTEYCASLESKQQAMMKEVAGHQNETQNLTAQMEALNEQVQFLETRKYQLTVEAEEWDKKVKELTETLGQKQDELKKMEENLTFKENELEVLRDCFVQLKAFEGDTSEEGGAEVDAKGMEEKLRDMMDVSRVNATLKASEEELESVKNKLYIETDARKEMEDQIEGLKREVDNLSLEKSKADRTAQEATTKLTVLTTYFKEKEVELQKELGEQETLKKQSASQLLSADEKTRDMEIELTTLRERVKDLQNEITSAERDFRAQIANNEKKAHENWLAARASDREAREARHESSILRQKLMDLERRQAVGLIRPLPTRGMPPPGLPNGPPPPLHPLGERPPFPPDRPLSRTSMPAFRDDELRGSPRPVRYPPPPPMDRRPFPPGMPPPPGMRMPPPPRDMRSPPGDVHSPPPYDRRPPPRELRSPPRDSPPPPFDRRPPPHHLNRSPPYRPDMGPPPHLRGGPPPPRMGPESPTGRDQERTGPRGNSPYDPPPRDRPPRQHSQV